jgi:DNA replication and repair protein RecF
MYLSRLTLTGFRTYPSLSLDFPAFGAFFTGNNGEGKTNLLEAIHLLCTGRSQRGASRGDMIAFGAEAAHIAGIFVDEETGARRETSIGFDRDKRLSMHVDGRKIEAISSWFGAAAVVSFGPEDLRLIDGPPSERRRFLDLLISQVSPLYLESVIRYRHALLNRNALLVAGADDAQLQTYEEQMAAFGSRIMRMRDEIVSFLDPIFARYCSEISPSRELASIEFRPSFPLENRAEEGWKNVFLTIMRNARNRDRKAGFSTVGPHRDDCAIFIDSRPAKLFSSQGQRRSLALSLRLSSIKCIEKYTKGGMIFLVDDAFSELDDERVARVYPLLESKGQVFFAAPSMRAIAVRERPCYRVHTGRVEPYEPAHQA